MHVGDGVGGELGRSMAGKIKILPLLLVVLRRCDATITSDIQLQHVTTEASKFKVVQSLMLS